VDERGVPLSVIVAGANVHDVKLLDETLEKSKENRREHLCADAGYVGAPAKKCIEDHGFTPHVRSRGEDTSRNGAHPDGKPRRWVVESSHSWFNKFRKIPTRYEKKRENYLALTHLAASVITYRKIVNGKVIYG
jgi:transposase